MNNVNKTLYIPLYGKALVSKKGVILKDLKAEEIWSKSQFLLKGKAKSKWLAYYMGMRSAVFDTWLKDKIAEAPDCVVLHLGAGLDGRVERIGATATKWFDVDLPAVIEERKRYYSETEVYRMISADIKNGEFVQALPDANQAIVAMEGVSMYLTNGELCDMFSRLKQRFPRLSILVDCYTPFAVKMTKIKNPIKTVGVNKVYGIKSPALIEAGTGLEFVQEREMTPKALIDELHGFERRVFKRLYAGKLAKKLYKLYEFEK